MEEKIKNVLKTALDIDREIELTDIFRQYDEWDSLGRLSLVAEIDTEFDFQIEEKDFEKLNTVDDLLNEIRKKIAGS